MKDHDRKPPSGEEDEDLVARAQEGDVRALEALLDRHQRQVLRLAAALGVPDGDRQDVAQEIFIRVFRHLRSVKKGKPFRAWLYRVSVNAVHDYRSRRRSRLLGEGPWEERMVSAPDPSPGPDGRLDQAELADRLDRAMDRLTERERAAFVLHEIEGLDTREIARFLGITRITVRRHLGLARKRIQDFFRND